MYGQARFWSGPFLPASDADADDDCSTPALASFAYKKMLSPRNSQMDSRPSSCTTIDMQEKQPTPLGYACDIYAAPIVDAFAAFADEDRFSVAFHWDSSVRTLNSMLQSSQDIELSNRSPSAAFVLPRSRTASMASTGTTMLELANHKQVQLVPSEAEAYRTSVQGHIERASSMHSLARSSTRSAVSLRSLARFEEDRKQDEPLPLPMSPVEQLASPFGASSSFQAMCALPEPPLPASIRPHLSAHSRTSSLSSEVRSSETPHSISTPSPLAQELIQSVAINPINTSAQRSATHSRRSSSASSTSRPKSVWSEVFERSLAT